MEKSFLNPKPFNLGLELRQAAEKGQEEECENILKSQSPAELAKLIDSVGERSCRTALHWAALRNHVDVVRLLVANKASITQDRNGKTPYDLTTLPEIKRIFLYSYPGVKLGIHKYPAKFEHKRKYGYLYKDNFYNTLLDFIVLTKAQESCEFFRNLNLNPNSYILGVPLFNLLNYGISNYEELCCYFLKEGADPNKQAHYLLDDEYNNTALHSILAHEFVNRAVFFIKSVRQYSKIPLNCKIQDSEGKTTLILAALLGNALLVNMLLNNFGLDAIDMQDHNGRTALHYAYLFGSSKMVKVLSIYGAKQNISDKNQNMPKDMLKLDAKVIRKVLLSFHIDPERDYDYSYEDFVYKEAAGLLNSSVNATDCEDSALESSYVGARIPVMGAESSSNLQSIAGLETGQLHGENKSSNEKKPSIYDFYVSRRASLLAAEDSKESCTTNRVIYSW